MNTLIHADIFFFVATIAVVIFAIGMLFFFYYVLRIMASINRIAQLLRVGADKVASDIGALRDAIKEEGAKLKDLTLFLGRWLIEKEKPKKRKVKSDE
ncbi:MAG: hypothetical protein A2836_00035 [Candidatus Taylorbacteria bacterium RIFCSPHIGHO2_01_FULL_45_63]|uniref:Uncharacterized protein n=1 Tax=Candidatus Taylorbacteria bacterium RIFCSPHIGHO2_02_FULL_45_35 TaxID=1802311 RepID=A0A1G2MVY0_9BACT|nr:MAG: hypothetical protein A2836_00035 [Candidatus Taylorbacteria bacterium RIFCSPHIGHO2_01_FULL_45_63]OHA27212.1 MAG: hypothetical protein A3D56_02020 [Candidatus Taylorbacteria bacterium RIFCSPHIGHO2_02_FULL_45_35]OHA33706.1 MAG: hypothetical protein A3A22_03955 [Candidatus Taylorbacteria bacterium RIFCSPLOWO2_01_FULL_45_34b]